MKDIHILRLSNVVPANSATNPLIRYGTNQNEYFIRTPPFLKQKGKCLVKVIGGYIMLTKSTQEPSNDDSIVPALVNRVFLQSNIPFLGFDSQTNGSTGAILGSINGNRASQAPGQALNSEDAVSFVCPGLPDEISIIKRYFNDDNPPIAVDASAIDRVVPCSVTLKIEFFE